MRCSKVFSRTASLLLVSAFVVVAGCSDDGPTTPSADGNGGAKIWYVDADATGSGSGSSWADAFTHPQYAVDAASAGEQVWVASGTYASLDPADHTVPVLTMKDSVEIYGGFAGGESSLSARDPEINITILQANNDAYHVVMGADDSRLDGFRIQGGMASGDNYPDNVGSGMLNDHTSPVVANCTFYGNSADRGGGVYNGSCSPVFKNCTFSGNQATNTTSSAGGGGGMYNSYSYSTVDTCYFYSNDSKRHGGGMFNNASSPVVTACVFQQNSCDFNGGGTYNDSYSSSSRKPTITDCIFKGNGGGYGAGMYNYFCSTIATRCTFEENEADHNGGGTYNENSYARLTDCVFTGNQSSGDGGGMYNRVSGQGSSPVLKNCMLRGNYAGNTGGGMYNYSSSPDISNCTITGNSANYGGATRTFNSAATITDCIVWGNYAVYNDPQFSFTGTTTPTVTYSDVDQAGYGLVPSGDADSNGNIRKDPIFFSGPQGNYYLSQTVCGQASNSPCVDAGSNTAEILQMGNRTTRTDEGPDIGLVDMGYHYIPQ